MSRTVFLRVLEYYAGILFLTTNRVGNFDPAFSSRIHVTLHYDHLSRNSRAQIWKLCIIKALGEQPPWLDDAYLYVLALEELNGREIRNAVAVAGSLARSHGCKLSMNQIERVLELRKFGRYLDNVDSDTKRQQHHPSTDGASGAKKRRLDLITTDEMVI